MLAFAEIWGGIDPPMHFLFIGKDESLSEQDNKSRTAIPGSFTLTMTPEH